MCVRYVTRSICIIIWNVTWSNICRIVAVINMRGRNLFLYLSSFFLSVHSYIVSYFIVTVDTRQPAVNCVSKEHTVLW